MKKILVAMSGGVDSSVAAKLLLERGFDVTGVTLKLYSNEDINSKEGTRTCCSLADIEDARSVCRRLGIEHLVFNFTGLFKETVMGRMASGYLAGITPNPCIDCNRFIKFDALLARALTLGYDGIATGHYARIYYDEAARRWMLARAEDSSKDQSYVLYGMTQEQLARTLLPLGSLKKSEIREIAQAGGFINAQKPDSQDICFVPDGDYASFIEGFAGSAGTPGSFVDAHGEKLGQHKGIAHYTIGQRKGLGLALGTPAFVTAKDACANTVTVGGGAQLFSKALIAGDVNLIAVASLDAPLPVQAKTRYSQPLQAATLYPHGEDKIRLEFEQAQRAITPGQAVVFYDGDRVVGGATIERAQ